SHTMRIFVVTALFCLLAVNISAESEYCDESLCPSGTSHIACNNDGSFSSSCPESATLLDIDQPARDTLLTAHLEVRQKWASGEGDVDSKACRMASISWNSELAKLAELNVKQCVMEHDACHNTAEFKYSGQNLYTTGYKGGTPPNLLDILKQAVTDWAKEGRYATADYLASYPANYVGPDIGHFTIVANERNVAVGCAASNYVSNGYITFLVACNYATSNFLEQPVFEACSEAASGCQSGTNSQYLALCTLDEKIDYNFESE
ncbi:hypothetical protein KR222_003311, partial [Zaprionus bogoriensis]